MKSGEHRSSYATACGQQLAVAFALVFPTVLTVTYFVLLADYPSGIQQAVYAVGKTVQFVFPLVWVFAVLQKEPRGSGLEGAESGRELGSGRRC